MKLQNIKGAFTYYVIIFLCIFDPLPSVIKMGHFPYLKIKRRNHSLTPPPPFDDYVLCERSLCKYLFNGALKKISINANFYQWTSPYPSKYHYHILFLHHITNKRSFLVNRYLIIGLLHYLTQFFHTLNQPDLISSL